MKIHQIDSAVVCGADYVGKWYCVDSAPGTDGDPVHRYLQEDGTWGKVTRYFDSRDEIERLLLLGHKPDFNMNRRELEDRALIREMAEDACRWNDEFDDHFGGGFDAMEDL